VRRWWEQLEWMDKFGLVVGAGIASALVLLVVIITVNGDDGTPPTTPSAPLQVDW